MSGVGMGFDVANFRLLSFSEPVGFLARLAAFSPPKTLKIVKEAQP